MASPNEVTNILWNKGVLLTWAVRQWHAWDAHQDSSAGLASVYPLLQVDAYHIAVSGYCISTSGYHIATSGYCRKDKWNSFPVVPFHCVSVCLLCVSLGMACQNTSPPVPHLQINHCILKDQLYFPEFQIVQSPRGLPNSALLVPPWNTSLLLTCHGSHPHNLPSFSIQ